MFGPYAGKLGEVATNDQASFLPWSAESTRVIDAQRAFSREETLPLIVVWTAEGGGGPVREEQRDDASRALASLAGGPGIAGQPSPAIASRDGKALQGVVQLRPSLGDESPSTLDDARRATAQVPGTTAQLAGPAASQADLSEAFSGVDGRARIEVTLRAAADGDAAKATVRNLRDAVHAVPGSGALVGGYTAQQYDTQETAEHDREIIVPVVLAIIVVILIGLLRSLPVPAVLVATVALNFAATLGVSALVFEHLFGFTGTDASVALYGFVFLVALGVDYNIFLMSRVREESHRHGVRRGVLLGLTSTGGVITSLLVPALVRDAGPRIWWPSSLSRHPDPSDPPDPPR
ncbi:MMPL family transporter [Actinomadura madurae]|uniref:MMPL family transporter n=1 Tax=Actinomadura madurae TaxID=1993 RepID=UPI000D91FEF9|nr:MMPL family transporter [Actinomadura madurae]SPT49405.1 Putative membrane protein ydgH [Actinomadura madurae]